MRIVVAMAYEKNITMSSNVADEVSMIDADARRLKQVLVNLLSNAVKYGKQGGLVEITVTDPDPEGGISIMLADTGDGIPKDQMDYILTPFGRLGNNDAYRSGGTGLGLPIVKSLIDMHGGDLNIDSTVGVGTRVTVKLPQQRRLA